MKGKPNENLIIKGAGQKQQLRNILVHILNLTKKYDGLGSGLACTRLWAQSLGEKVTKMFICECVLLFSF